MTHLDKGSHPSSLFRMMKRNENIELLCRLYNIDEKRLEIGPYGFKSYYSLTVGDLKENANSEAAVLSIVFVGDRIHHMPMIDCDDYPDHSDIKNILKELGGKVAYVYKSSNREDSGYHVYFPGCYARNFEWMCATILSNNNNEWVDTQWLAHCMSRGYLMLRTTCGTKKYAGSGGIRLVQTINVHE